MPVPRRPLLSGFLFLLAACAAEPVAPLTLQPVSFNALPGWRQSNHEDALAAFRQSCRKPTATNAIAGHEIAAASWNNVCTQAASAQNAEAFFAEAFLPYIATSAQRADGLITGYYEPLLHGSLAQDARYKFPVWGLPSDFKTPYLTRREIDEKGLSGKAKPVLYVDDAIDLFFLHIQGSGRVALPDGRVMQLAYVAKNQQPYTAIGKILIERGEIPAAEMTAQRLKDWLRSHPQQAQEIMWQNASYVFFSLKDSGQNAVGAQGVPLTPEASLAVDPAILPYGVPVYLETTLPDASPYTRLVVAQDTGSAIKGPLRGDLFFGPGDRAEKLAGEMKQPARFYLLLPKNVAAQ